MQPVGYIFAAIGPLAVGAIVAATDSVSAVLWLMAGSGVLLALAGWRGAADVLVDDELAAAR